MPSSHETSLSESLALLDLHNDTDSNSVPTVKDDNTSSGSSSVEADLEILLLDQEWVINGGSEPRRMPISVEGLATFSDIINLVKVKLNYERDTLVFEDERYERPVRDSKEWETYLDTWRAAAPERRIDKVQLLAREAAERTRGISWQKVAKLELPEQISMRRTQIRGFEQIYELLEHPQNIPGIERSKETVVNAVVSGLVPHDVADEVAGAAALVAWKMVEKSKLLCETLMAADVAQRCVALVQHDVLQREDARNGRVNATRAASAHDGLILGLQQLALKELGGARYPRKKPKASTRKHLFLDCDGSVFCTRTSLDACQNIVGLLCALARAKVRARDILASGAYWLLALSAECDATTEARLMAASALCRSISKSIQSRKLLLSRTMSLPLLCDLLHADNAPFLPLLAAATISALFRSMSIRCLAHPSQLGDLFACLIRRIAASMSSVQQENEARHCRERKQLGSASCPERDGESESGSVGESNQRQQDVVHVNQGSLRVSVNPTMHERWCVALHTLDHSCLAVWGCAAALRERGLADLERLYSPPIANWSRPADSSEGVASGADNDKRPENSGTNQTRRMSTLSPASIRLRRGSRDSDDSESEPAPALTSEPEVHEESWPEILVRIGSVSVKAPFSAPQSALCALANALAGASGPQAVLYAGKTPWCLMHDLTLLVEKASNLDVRVSAASALARSTTTESEGLEAFYLGAFDTQTGSYDFADCRLAAVLNSAIESHSLDSAISAVLLNFALHAYKGMPRNDAVLQVHVALIKCECSGLAEASMLQGTLRRGCLSIWALARCQENRRRLNEFGAPSALARALCGGARLVTKEIAVAALWLLACDERGAIKVALAQPSQSQRRNQNVSSAGELNARASISESSQETKEVAISNLGSLSTLVGIVNFDPQSIGYIPIRTLAVGTLCKLSHTSDDLLSLVAAYASHFVTALYDLAKGSFPADLVPNHVCHNKLDSAVPPISLLKKNEAPDEFDKVRARRCVRSLQVLAVDLTFRLGECAEGHKAVCQAMGPRALEHLSALLVTAPGDNEMRALGAFRIAKLACDPARRRALDESHVVTRLTGNVNDESAPPDVRLYSLHALLNLSSECTLQPKICRIALEMLLRTARSAESVPVRFESENQPPEAISRPGFSMVDAEATWIFEERTTPLLLSSLLHTNGGIMLDPTDESKERCLDLEARYAQSILANLSKNVRCRAMMYQIQLTQVSCALASAKKANNRRARDAINAATDMPQDDGPASFSGYVSDVVDDRTLVAFLNQKRQAVSPADDLNFVDTLTNEQLNRLRPHFFDPVSRLWEDAPPDANDLSAYDNQRTTSNQTSNPRPQTCATLLCPSSLTNYQPRRASYMGEQSADEGQLLGCASMSNLQLSPMQMSASRCQTASSVRVLARPRSPLRSSHRLGPTAGCGVPALPQGECRWEPRVLSYKRTRANGRKQGAGHNSPRVVELDPSTSYHHITFHAPLKKEPPVKTKRNPKSTELEPSDISYIPFSKQTHSAQSSWHRPYTPASLAKFKHAPGAKLYSDLFPCFTLKVDDANNQESSDAKDPAKTKQPATYEHCFFYYTSSIVCEAIDPGPVELPQPPVTLDSIVQLMPPLPNLQGPTIESLPREHNPGWQSSPNMTRHSLKLSARTGVLGGIPDEALPLFSRMVEKPAVVESEEEQKHWRLEESIFASRKEEADSKAFYETPKVWRKALDVDWRRLLQEGRFARFVSRNDEGVQQGQSLDEEIAEIKTAFAKRYADILRVFDFYCASSSIVTKAAFSISENCYNRFLQECRIPDDSTACTVEECSRIFVACNYESDKTTQEAEINEDKALMRHEFIECLVRIAVARFGHETKDVSDCLDRLFDEVIYTNIPDECKLDPDIFRRERLYSEDTESGYVPHAKVLKIIYNKYSMLNPAQGKAKFGLHEWTTLLAETRILGELITMREVRLSFWWSRMVVADEFKSRFKFMTHSWVEFLEAIGRIADLMSLPTDEDLASVNAINMIDFKSKLESSHFSTQEKHQRRPSAIWNNIKSRPLSEKVDKFCKLLIGRLAIKYKGNIAAGGKRATGIVGTYITKQQLQEMTLD